MYIYIYIHTHIHLLTPWSRVLLEKLTGFAANQEIPTFYGIHIYIHIYPGLNSAFKELQHIHTHRSLGQPEYIGAEMVRTTR